MSHQEGTFTAAGNTPLFYQAWVPDSPKAVVVLVHGLADHSSRYSNVVDYLTPKDYAIWTFDQRGHGRSPGGRCYVNRFTDLIADLDRFIFFVGQQNPDLPLFLLGHSMGALESALYVCDYHQGVSGIILSGLVLKAGQSVPEWALSMARFLSSVLPRLGIQKLECDTISRDTIIVEGYVKDPLVYRGKIPARTATELLSAMALVQSRLSSIKMPVLLLHGAADRLADPSSSQVMYDSVSSSDKEIHLFPGCYHEIFNEPCRDFVLGVLSHWLDRHLALTPAALV